MGDIVKMREDLITRGEIEEWITRLLKAFHMDEGYPSTYVLNHEGETFGVVGDEMGAILEEGLGILSALREELGLDDEELSDDVEYNPLYEIEFELDDDSVEDD